MAYLGNAPARSFISFERQVFTIVNSQTAYTLNHSVSNENDIRLVINNVVQQPGSSYAYTASGNTLTLASALTSGSDEMYCVYLGRANATEVPASGSVTGDMLSKPFNYDSGTLYLDDTNNRVGIGTSSPGTTLDVRGELRAYDGGTQLTSLSTTGSIELSRTNNDAFIDLKTSTAEDFDVRLQQHDTNGFRIITGGSGQSERLLIRGDGRSYIKGQDNSNRELICFQPKTGGIAGGTGGSGVAFTHAGIAIDRTWGNYPGITAFNVSGSSQTNQLEFRVHGTNASYASYTSNPVASSGSDFSINFRIDGSTYSSSDRRKKTNINLLPEGSLSKILELQPKSYDIVNSNLDIDQANQIGFIAQDVQSVIPEAVKHYPDEDTPLENGFANAYSLNITPIIAHLTKALQEANTKIEQLETRIQTLENN